MPKTKAILTPHYLDYTQVVRVAVNNNFNCTDEEYTQLDEYVKNNPHRYFFVNANIRTPKIITLNNHSYKAVITVNPDLHVNEHLVERLYEIDPALVAFTRVKYLPSHHQISDLIRELSAEHYNTVVTLQRFNGKKSLLKHTSLEYYEHSYNRYRLHGEALTEVQSLVDSLPNTFICDRSGTGCEGCGLCSMLTIGEKLPVYSLNLSSSGLCPYSCPDCYAKTMQIFLKGCGHPLIKYDVIKKNAKQSGRTEHIKHALLKKV